ncbi:MAG: chorismate pyruvate-lyase family protein [Candidatus Hydrothermarchaeales archaeon]
MKTLSELKDELELTPVQIMLLANTGSMTVLLEALFGSVHVETVTQRVARADQNASEKLQIPLGAAVNHRIVRLVADERVLVYAESFAPLSRLEEGFKEDIMKRDIPIGGIMEEHCIESRREILGYEFLRAGDEFAEIFSAPADSIVLKRNYNIIHNQQPLINITEVFSYEMAK